MDDLLDLNWSDKLSAPVITPQSASTSRRPTPNPTFDFVAKPASNSNGPNYHSSLAPVRTQTPQTAPLPSQARLATPNSLIRAHTPQPPAPSSDAFSSLLSLDTASSSAAKTLSLAERQKQIADERKLKEEHERQQFTAYGSFWDTLGSSVPGQPQAGGIAKGASTSDPISDMLAPQPVRTAQITPIIKSRPPISEWDDDDTFLTQMDTTGTPQPPADPFDFDSLQTSIDSASPAANGRSTSTLSSRDFSRDDRDRPRNRDHLAPNSPKSTAQSRPRRSSSPPPHLVMRIMELGFSPEEARSALAQTSGGLDVQAAMDILLSTPGPSQQQEPEGASTPGDHVTPAERRRRRRAGPTRASIQPRSREEIRRDDSVRAEYGDQADKIITQATEMGQTFLKTATSFWNSGKEKAMKMYEEQRKATETAKRREIRDGRPRWMVVAEDGERVAHDHPQTPDDRPQRVRPDPRSHEPDLLDTAPTSYQPASRRRAPDRSATSTPRPRLPSPQPLKKRILVSASADQLSKSATLKTQGNEHFKLGRFAEAESAYTAAIKTLPEGHLFLVPLYNNRAAARAKLGESSSAAEDCTAVIALVGQSYHSAQEAPLPTDHAEIKLGDALSKALVKRAQAWEMGEKWSKALEDWERVLGLDTVILGVAATKTRALASEGIHRARKMLDPPKAKAPPRPPKPVATRAQEAPSQAVQDRRRADKAAEAEEAERLAAKDAVDAKVMAWKGGKENNLRALIASLDTILWDDILSGGLKVGMHELITEKQVKIKYMKVIARLHPDKLNSTKTTTEQRMLANSAFSALNDAWQTFNGA